MACEHVFALEFWLPRDLRLFNQEVTATLRKDNSAVGGDGISTI